MSRSLIIEYLQATILLIVFCSLFQFFKVDQYERVNREMLSHLIQENTPREPDLIPVMSDEEYMNMNDEGYYDDS